MSEYRYYEFAALDTPLTRAQQAELRKLSTRAAITPTSFSNEYHWGDLKGDPVDWMARYFDAHLFVDEGDCQQFMLTVPRHVLDEHVVTSFAGALARASGYGGSFDVSVQANDWLIRWALNHEESGYYDEEDGGGSDYGTEGDSGEWMGELLPLREELLRGDQRALYLGWLAQLCSQELEDDDLEPPVPAGLRTLTRAQSNLARFLGIDEDILTVAASKSADLSTASEPEAAAATDAWLAQLPVETLREAMRMLVNGEGVAMERQMVGAHAEWQRRRALGPDGSDRAPRTVSDLEAARQAVMDERLERKAAERQIALAEERQRRTLHLQSIVKRAEQIWAEVDLTLQRGVASAYEKALRSVKELAEAYQEQGRSDEFRRGLVRLLSTHGKRPAWLDRLRNAGLM